MGRKKLEELTILDNFMFSAAMITDTENCRRVLECALGMAIDRVEVVNEKTMMYHPEFKGIRLDVYAKEMKEDGTVNRHFDVEMQVVNKKIFKRSRYYQSQMDMEILGTGVSYEELPDTYVIFICDFDPVGLGKYRYTICRTLKEDNSYDYNDGTHTVFLSTKGTNDGEVPDSLVKFLKYVGARLEDSEKDYDDQLVNRLQETVRRIKSDREMGARYMLFGEMLKDEFAAGKLEGMREGRLEGMREGKFEGKLEGKLESIKILLSVKGMFLQSLEDKLADITDEEVLGILVKKAVTVTTIEEFEEELDKLTASE